MLKKRRKRKQKSLDSKIKMGTRSPLFKLVINLKPIMKENATCKV